MGKSGWIGLSLTATAASVLAVGLAVNAEEQQTAAEGKAIFVVVTQCVPKQGFETELLAAAIESNRTSEDQPGLIGYQVLRPKTENSPITVITTWETEADYKAWQKTMSVTEVRSGWTDRLDVKNYEMAAAWNPDL